MGGDKLADVGGPWSFRTVAGFSNKRSISPETRTRRSTSSFRRLGVSCSGLHPCRRTTRRGGPERGPQWTICRLTSVPRIARCQLDGTAVADPMVVWLTGLSGSGKTTLSNALYRLLKPRLPEVEVLDGDAVRSAFGADLGYTEQDRVTRVRRV